MKTDAFICDGVRTAIGKLGGGLSTLRADDLAAIPIRALRVRNKDMDLSQIDEVIIGCANQSGEDNRNVARMAVLLSGLPETVPGMTVNRLCASGLDAVGWAARAIRSGEAGLMIAGGAESMTRAPFVMGKPRYSFDRGQIIQDTTMGWRFKNPAMETLYGTESMSQTAQNIADQWGVTREGQDRFALASQDKAAAAILRGRFDTEIIPVEITQRRAASIIFEKDEHPRASDYATLSKLRPILSPESAITAGNASGLNDGAAAMIIASEDSARANELTPRARILGMASAGVAPRIMGIGPVAAAQKLFSMTGLKAADFDVIELNEAFAAQAIAVLRDMDISPQDPRVNPNGGAIALGHPLGMSGARLALTATEELQRSGGKYALCFLCVGVGQGVALALERV